MVDHLDAAFVLWVFAAIQGFGLAAALLSRVAEGSVLQPWFQRLFFITLLATGATTILARQLGSGYWLLSAGTLGLMVVMAVCDFRQDQRAFTL